MKILWAHAYRRYGHTQLMLNGAGPARAQRHIKKGRRLYLGSVRLGPVIGNMVERVGHIDAVAPDLGLNVGLKALILDLIAAKVKTSV
jgi:hypothetical protein